MEPWIYFDSRTGNVGRFVAKLTEATGWPVLRIEEDTKVEQDGHLITFTTSFGEVPPKTKKFMASNASHIHSITVSGNQNWGLNYGKAGYLLALKYHLPLLMKFELSGTTKDVQELIKKINEYDRYIKQEMDLIK